MTELYPDTNRIKRYSSNDPEYRALVERIEREKKEEEERMKNTKDAFFVYYVIDYFGTGEGRTIYLFIERNCDRERILEDIKKDVGAFYFCGIEEFSEERFLNDYSNLLSDNIKRMIEKKDVPSMSFSQMYHFNYS
jgi:hypothetical protein